MNYELIILMVLPIALALPMYMVGRKNTSLAKWLTTLIIASTTLYSMWLWIKHFANSTLIYDGANSEEGFKMLYKAKWIPDLGVQFAVGADGLSMPLIVLTQVVFLVSVVSSFYIKDQEATYYALILVLNSAVIGTFVALDLLLFYIAWELVLVPMFFLIHIWGGDNRKYAAIKFFIYTHLASLVMLIGLFYIYIEGGSTFYLPDLKDNFTAGTLSFGTISLIFWLVFIGFVTKFPQVPVHTWLPDAHVQAPSPGSAILAGLLLKMGGYGLMRVGFWLLAGATNEEGEYFFDSEEGERIRIIIAIVGVVSMVYPAFVALRQDDLKRMIAYSSISHMGIVLLGLAAYNTNGFNAAMFMMIAHGVISPALFLLSGVIEHNTKSHTRLMSKVGGLGHKMPFATGLFVFMGFASAGLPGLAGFVAEFAAFLGMFESDLLTDGIHIWIPVIAVMSIIITAGYYLWAIQKVLFNEPTGELDDAGIAKWWETGPILVLAIFTLVLGLYPKIVYGTLDDWSNSIPGIPVQP